MNVLPRRSWNTIGPMTLAALLVTVHIAGGSRAPLLVVAALGHVWETQRRAMPDDAGITVYADADFRGHAVTFHSDTPDVRRAGLNDRISSVRIAGGDRWEVCADIDYGGRCHELSGSESDLRRAGWNDAISSLRPVRAAGERRSRWTRRQESRSSSWIVLFDERRFRGRSYRVDDATSLLSAFQDRSESIQVFGGTWQLCDDADFRGRCVTVSSHVNNLGTLGLRDRVSSVRPWRH